MHRCLALVVSFSLVVLTVNGVLSLNCWLITVNGVDFRLNFCISLSSHTHTHTHTVTHTHTHTHTHTQTHPPPPPLPPLSPPHTITPHCHSLIPSLLTPSFLHHDPSHQSQSFTVTSSPITPSYTITPHTVIPSHHPPYTILCTPLPLTLSPPHTILLTPSFVHHHPLHSPPHTILLAPSFVHPNIIILSQVLTPSLPHTITSYPITH